MSKTDISSMFLVPQRIYNSMLSNIEENDVREDLQNLNRQKNDGNYIENAINFNKQQKLQKKLMRDQRNTTEDKSTETENNYDFNTTTSTPSQNITSNFDPIAETNTPYITNQPLTRSPYELITPTSSPISKSNLPVKQTSPSVTFSPQLSALPSTQATAQNIFDRFSPRALPAPSPANISSSINQFSTPIRTNQEESLIVPYSPIRSSLSEPNRAGRFNCPFPSCRAGFRNREKLRNHILDIHNRDINESDRQIINERQESNAAVPQFANTGATNIVSLPTQQQQFSNVTRTVRPLPAPQYLTGIADITPLPEIQYSGNGASSTLSTSSPYAMAIPRTTKTSPTKLDLEQIKSSSYKKISKIYMNAHIVQKHIKIGFHLEDI